MRFMRERERKMCCYLVWNEKICIVVWFWTMMICDHGMLKCKLNPLNLAEINFNPLILLSVQLNFLNFKNDSIAF